MSKILAIPTHNGSGKPTGDHIKLLPFGDKILRHMSDGQIHELSISKEIVNELLRLVINQESNMSSKRIGEYSYIYTYSSNVVGFMLCNSTVKIIDNYITHADVRDILRGILEDADRCM